jgi:hypothetical protein
MSDVDFVLGSLHLIVRHAVGGDAKLFAIRWGAVEESFRRWLSRLPAVSPLSRNLELLSRISDAFANPQLKSDPRVVAIVFEGAAQVGDQVQSSAEGPKYRVLDRKITDDFLVHYTVQDERGAIISWRFAN